MEDDPDDAIESAGDATDTRVLDIEGDEFDDFEVEAGDCVPEDVADDDELSVVCPACSLSANPGNPAKL